MRLIFDHLPLAPTSTPFGLTGVGRWTLNALKNLSALAPDWQLEGLGVGTRKIHFKGSEIGSNVGWNQIYLPRRAFWLAEAMNLLPPLETFVGPLDVMLGTAYVTRKTRNAAEIPVIYDMSVVKHGDTHPRRRVWYLTKTLPAVLQRASMVVTLSDVVKTEIAEIYGFDPRRIAVIPPGCDHQFFHTGSVAESKQVVEGDYLLAVGTIEPRKNLGGLLKAYGSLKQKRTSTPPLVLVGGMGWKSKEIQEALERVRDGSVKWLGYVPGPALANLYRNAMGFVYPSFYEGFGMPIVEAMAAGCPVITSIGSGTEEAAGDASILVDPNNIEELGEAIERLIDDPALRSTLRDQGLRQAKQFTWERTAAGLKTAIAGAVEVKLFG